MVEVTDRPARFPSWCGVLAVLCTVLVVGFGCRRAPSSYGMPVAPGPAASLAEVLPGIAEARDEAVVVEARIAEVCPSAGCWCILEDGEDRLYVTLATFVLPRSAEGERCRVAGKIVDQDGRPTLLATGLDILADGP